MARTFHPRTKLLSKWSQLSFVPSSFQTLINTCSRLNRAASLKIRVAYGFLSPPINPVPVPKRSAPVQRRAVDSGILEAILSTGGVFATIDSAAAQQNFVQLVYKLGITAVNGPADDAIELLPGLILDRIIAAASGPETFYYMAVSGEHLRLTLTDFNIQSLEVVVVDVNSNLVISTGVTDSVNLEFTFEAGPDTVYRIIVTPPASLAATPYSIGFGSSIPIRNNTIPVEPSTSSTSSSASSTASSSSSISISPSHVSSSTSSPPINSTTSSTSASSSSSHFTTGHNYTTSSSSHALSSTLYHTTNRSNSTSYVIATSYPSHSASYTTIMYVPTSFWQSTKTDSQILIFLVPQNQAVHNSMYRHTHAHQLTFDIPSH